MNKFEIYPEHTQSTGLATVPTGNWRWRLKASNGNIVADSGEAYSSKGNAKRAIGRMEKMIFQYVPIIEVKS